MPTENGLFAGGAVYPADVVYPVHSPPICTPINPASEKVHKAPPSSKEHKGLPVERRERISPPCQPKTMIFMNLI